MDTVEFQYGNWQLKCLSADGARIGMLRFAGRDLLTGRADNFRPPSIDYGKYETRPVYGYDDCFPTVDPCKSPVDGSDIADHGLLCWLPWRVEISDNRLICRVVENALNIRFKRTLIFGDNNLKWEFEIFNDSDKQISFLHVAHALMPLDRIDSVALPDFDELFDEINNRVAGENSPAKLSEALSETPRGQTKMLLLRGVKNGKVEIALYNSLKLLIEYPAELFPTLGIWWNNGGYPDENGLRRTECAFEPIPGPVSSLLESYRQGRTLIAEPGRKLDWQINWKLENR